MGKRVQHDVERERIGVERKALKELELLTLPLPPVGQDRVLPTRDVVFVSSVTGSRIR